METIATKIPENTLPASLHGLSKENMHALYIYNVDKVIGTEGGKSWAHGKNGLTISLIASCGSEILDFDLEATEISQKNLAAIRLLDEWVSEPDDLGEKFWKEFEQEISSQRFYIP